MRADLAARRTSALLIVRRGKIVYEWYAPGNGPANRQRTASLAKALVGGLSLLVAMNDGSIGPGDLAAKYIPDWRNNPRKPRITIRQIAFIERGITGSAGRAKSAPRRRKPVFRDTVG